MDLDNVWWQSNKNNVGLSGPVYETQALMRAVPIHYENLQSFWSYMIEKVF